MSFEQHMTVPCTIHHRTAGTQDDWGQAPSTVADVATTCYAEQVSRAEKGSDEVDIEKWDLYLRPTETIAETDSVTLPWGLFEVTGPPEHAASARDGEVHHLEVTLRRAE